MGFKKKLLSCIMSMVLVIAMLLGVVGLNVVKAEIGSGPLVEDDEDCKITWVVDDDGTLTISGEGEMEDYKRYPEEPWWRLAGEIKKVVVEDGITHIGTKAFMYFDNLNSVVIGDDVEELNGSFIECCELKDVTIGKSVRSVNDFIECRVLKSYSVSPDNEYLSSSDGVLFNKDQSKLLIYPMGKFTDYTVPDSVTEIAEHAFMDNAHIKNIIVPDGVERIQYEAFANCRELETVTLPKSIVHISDRAFNCCPELKSSITIPDGQTSIGKETFYYCMNLPSVSIPKSVTSIEENAFYFCSALRDVYYSGTMEDWNNINFSEGNNRLESSKIHCIDGTINDVVAVTSIMLTETAVSITKGKTHTLTAGIAPSEAEDKTITWVSSDTSVATVNNGIVTAKKAGTATITAMTSNGLTATCEVTVPGLLTTSLSTYKKVEKVTLNTVGLTKVTYKTSKKSVATVSKSGVVTGKKKGTATITVTGYDNGAKKTYKCKVTVKNCSLTLKKSKATVKVGNTYQIVATTKPSAKVTYKSSKKSIATVDENGLITAVKKGKTTITCKANGLSKKFTVTVKK